MAEIDRSRRCAAALVGDRTAGPVGPRTAFGTLGERAADVRGGL